MNSKETESALDVVFCVAATLLEMEGPDFLRWAVNVYQRTRSFEGNKFTLEDLERARDMLCSITTMDTPTLVRVQEICGVCGADRGQNHSTACSGHGGNAVV